MLVIGRHRQGSSLNVFVQIFSVKLEDWDGKHFVCLEGSRNRGWEFAESFTSLQQKWDFAVCVCV